MPFKFGSVKLQDTGIKIAAKDTHLKIKRGLYCVFVGAFACMCLCVRGRKNEKQPLWTAAISNNSRAFYQSGADHQLVE